MTKSTLFFDFVGSLGSCVECLADEDCTDSAAPLCDTASSTCVACPHGDSDGDGVCDECSTDAHCTSGASMHCTAAGTCCHTDCATCAGAGVAAPLQRRWWRRLRDLHCAPVRHYHNLTHSRPV